MTLNSLLALSFALIIIAATPGPGVIMTITRSLQSGFRAGAWLAAGIVVTDLVVLIITLSGLSLISSWSQPGLVVLKWLGAFFLLWMAWQSWYRPPLQTSEQTLQPNRDFLTGMAVSLTNPVLFYLAFLPAFVDIQQLDWLNLSFLTLLITFIISSVLIAFAAAAASIQPLLFKQNGVYQLWLNRLSACVLILLAIWLMQQNIEPFD